VADALAESGASALFSSDLTRAMQTAVAISLACGLPIMPDARLREIDAGRWTNRLSDEVAREEPERVDAWNHRPATTRPPDGEGLLEAQRRILAFVAERIPAYAGQSVIVATHGAILQTLMAAAEGIPLAELWLATPAANGAIVRLEWDDGQAANGASALGAGRLRLLGPPSVDHLARLGAAGVTLGSAGGPGPGPA
jgi:broad specificity phosphatase PhoE